MTQINNINNVKPVNNALVVKYATTVPSDAQKPQIENSKNDLISLYLQNLALANTPTVKKIEQVDKKQAEPYKNNLKTMIQNNESVMLAIAPRLFTAVDLNGDEKVSLSDGEKAVWCLSAHARPQALDPVPWL